MAFKDDSAFFSTLKIAENTKLEKGFDDLTLEERFSELNKKKINEEAPAESLSKYTSQVENLLIKKLNLRLQSPVLDRYIVQCKSIIRNGFDSKTPPKILLTEILKELN